MAELLPKIITKKEQLQLDIWQVLFARLNIHVYREFAKQMNEDDNLTSIEVSMFEVQFGFRMMWRIIPNSAGGGCHRLGRPP